MNADENVALMMISVLIAGSGMLLKISGISVIKIIYHCIKIITYLVVLSMLTILIYFAGLYLGSELNIDPLVTKVCVIGLIIFIVMTGLKGSKQECSNE